jgi:hypothetical protein
VMEQNYTPFGLRTGLYFSHAVQSTCAGDFLSVHGTAQAAPRSGLVPISGSETPSKGLVVLGDAIVSGGLGAGMHDGIGGAVA